MKVYQEITILPSEEIELYFMWEKLYQQLHLILVENLNEKGKSNISVSFPKYRQDKRWLGDKLRLFAESEHLLDTLNLSEKLARLSDYIHITSIRDVPNSVSGYTFFKRLNDKSNKEKLARRRAKRLNISFDEALAYFKSNKERLQPKRALIQYPFISMTSLSTGNKYPITIIREETEALIYGEGFSTYGLSSDTTDSNLNSSVPIFN